MKSKKTIILLLLLIGWNVVSLSAQSTSTSDISRHFENIRHNRAELASFFKAFPKGGDLHHHFDGSVYAETYLDIAIQQNLWVHLESLNMQKAKPAGKDTNWVSMQTYSQSPGYPVLRERLMQRWSVRNFQPGFLTPEAHFFNAFMGFIPVMLTDVKTGLEEIKARAIQENVHYIETIFLPMFLPELPREHSEINERMLAAQANRDGNALEEIFNQYRLLLKPEELQGYAQAHNQLVDSLHAGMETPDFSIRYQNYVVRVFQPSLLFRDLYAAFMSADASALIVNVNIVAPEDDPVTIRDYWLQMQMYRYFHGLFPQVKYAMHAGELSPGLVKPEDMSWHIREAIQIAGASRIGHGTDLAWEKSPAALLNEMKQRNIPVEINLSSNEFLLGVSHDEHPLMMYHKAGVPLVLSTDDAGVLRGSLTEEYILLALRYPEIKYEDIRKISLNGILYGFLDEDRKQMLMSRLEDKLIAFEKSILSEH